ncbi:MAG: signal transduction histidine kinase [Gammaproteobacteria bacterium]|jgi:signal transduction histidine kinase
MSSQTFKTYCLKQWQSLVFRILLYFIIAAIFIAAILSASFYGRLKPHFEKDLLPNVAQYVDYLLEDIGSPPSLARARELSHSLNFEISIEGPDVKWSSNPQLKAIDSYHWHIPPKPYKRFKIGKDDHDFRVMAEHGEYRYLFVLENKFRSGSKSRYRLLFVLLGIGLLILYFVVRRLVLPLRKLLTQVEAIGQGEFSTRDELAYKGEMRELSSGINLMSEKIQSMLDGKSGLLLAISHELRSPLARMRVNIELLETNRLQQNLIDDIKEMDDLIGTILESERLNTDHAILNPESHSIGPLVQAVIEDYFRDAPLITELPDISAEVDAIKFKLLAKNLISNALHYSADSKQPVEIKLSSKDESLVLSIVDYGKGISASELNSVTDAFYRVDSARTRTRTTGGYGLGLYLCRLICEAHQGELKISSILGKGTQVTAIWPLKLSSGRV